MKSSGIGGQAVLEGVMMRNKSQYAVAVRKPDGTVELKKDTWKSEGDRPLFFRLPFVRGIMAFADSLVLGMKTLTYSAGFYEEEESLQQKEVVTTSKEASKDAQTLQAELANAEKKEQLEMILTVLLSVVLAVAVFVALPFGLSMLLKERIQSQIVLVVLEGCIRIALFMGYIYAISFMQDIRRVFMYHGAEHKTINCVENGLDLTVENVRGQSRYHKRCGTSFLFVVMLISIVFFLFLHFDNVWMRLLSRILLVPVVAGVSYEFIRLAGNSENKWVDLLSKPGMCLQKLTTKEPDDGMIEVAIASVEAVFDWKEYQSRLQAVRKSTKRKKVAKEMMEAGMTAPIPKLDKKAKKKMTRGEIAKELQRREEEHKQRVRQRELQIAESNRREKEMQMMMDEVSKRKAQREALAKAKEEEDEDDLQGLDRFFDSTKEGKENAKSVDDMEE